MPQILVLEPYRPLRQALALLLQRAGWRVVTTHSDRETIAALAQDVYHVLLVNLGSLTGEGWRVLQALQRAPTGLAVVALLNPESCRRPEAQALGACVMVPTPVRREALLTGVQAAFTVGRDTRGHQARGGIPGPCQSLLLPFRRRAVSLSNGKAPHRPHSHDESGCGGEAHG